MSKRKTIWVDANTLTDVEVLGIVGMARAKLRRVGDCLEWGYASTSGNRHATRVENVDPENSYKVHTLDVLMRAAGKEVSPTSLYQTTCGNPRCMNVEHIETKQPIIQNGEVALQYQADYKLAVEMLQYGWALTDTAKSTSQQMVRVVKEIGVSYPADAKNRQPLTYRELFRLAEVLSRTPDDAVNIYDLVKTTGLDLERLLKNGAAVKALRRRMTTTADADALRWFLACLCDGYPMSEACKKANKNGMYAVQLLGACYGY